MQSNRTIAFVIVIVVGAMMLLTLPAVHAQNNTATLFGTTMAASANVGNVKIVLTGVDTKERKEVTSGKDGKYSIPQLAPGKYVVEAVGTTGKCKITGIVLKAGEKKELVLALGNPINEFNLGN